MCGIAGSVSWGKPDQPEHIVRVLERLEHRGPNASGLQVSEEAILGHRRLSILDLRTAADQPMRDRTRRFLISFNGEIYNYKDLRSRLEQRGIVFQTESDTEVLLEAWALWGIETLQQCVGMFAFALWDSAEHILFLARDRMGEKPLYYTALGEDLTHGLLFASELTALLPYPALKREVNFDAVVQYLSTNYIFGAHSILRSVHKLAPAHVMIYQKGRTPDIRCYWPLETYFHHKPHWSSSEKAQEAFQHLLQRAVREQRQSDVPLGTFLSGGVDSSTITGALVRSAPQTPLSTFSIGFSEKSFDESAQSRFVAQHFQTQHFEKIASLMSLEDILHALRIPDEPFADSSLLPMSLLAAFARTQVTVCLSGDGADELFGGYETYVADSLFQRLSCCLPKRGFSVLGALLRRFWPVSYTKVSFDYKLRQFVEGCALGSPSQAHMFWRCIFTPTQIHALLVDPDAAADKDLDAFCYIHPFAEKVAQASYLDQAMYLDQKVWLPDDILTKVDRTTMAYSLEVRAPFLDHRIVEFAAGLPVSWKVRGMKKKLFLKNAQRGLVPDRSLYQKKKGFSAPVSLWLKGVLRDCAQDITRSSRLLPWFRQGTIQRLWQEHETGHADHGLRLFGLLCLGLWMERFQEN
ncbi:MAG: asparagine synthase (glutamine-hydrolyzing) [Holosporales bacterium]|jgi:asparagine synthase (glutamine-hydrolysing)|nr:asparagine synthase (glutamine-hydrolyzing) [Holosporales bacterium]